MYGKTSQHAINVKGTHVAKTTSIQYVQSREDGGLRGAVMMMTSRTLKLCPTTLATKSHPPPASPISQYMFMGPAPLSTTYTPLVRAPAW